MEEVTFYFRDYYISDNGHYVVVVAESIKEAEAKAEQAVDILALQKSTMIQWFRCGLWGQQIKYTNDYRNATVA